MPVVINENTLPHVEVAFQENVTGEQLREFFSYREAKMREGIQISLLLDASTASIPERALQKEYARWMKEHQTEIKVSVAATAIVVRSAGIQFVISAIMALQSSPSPARVFSGVDAARLWVREQYASFRHSPRSMRPPDSL